MKIFLVFGTRLLYKSEQPMNRDAFKKVIEDSEQEEGKEEFGENSDGVEKTETMLLEAYDRFLKKIEHEIDEEKKISLGSAQGNES